MGGTVSTGRDNDDLVDNLLEADYINCPKIERVFRAVDRGNYFLPEARLNAYRDMAWRFGNLHMSAPCIYSEVMGGLALEPGLSFLNIGSGSGYLSTMVGLILGPYGINHGIELKKDVVEYANTKLEEFKKRSHAIDEYDFCEPRFVEGNCLCLSPEVQLYDRVYCGAACPEEYEEFMKNLIKVGGILIMPINDKLLQYTRINETQWIIKNLLPVTFATLIPPTESEKEKTFKMLDIEPMLLQEACRAAIRIILRSNTEKELPQIKKRVRMQPKRPRQKRALRQLVVPIFGDDSDGEDSGRDLGRWSFHTDPDFQNLGQDYSDGVNSLLDIMLGIRQQRERSDNPTVEQNTEQKELNVDEMENTQNVESVSNNAESTNSDVKKEKEEETETSTISKSVLLKNEKKQREKVDSGFGDENLSSSSNSKSDDESSHEDMDVETDSGSDDERVNKRTSREEGLSRNKYKRVALGPRRYVESESDSDVPTQSSNEAETNDQPKFYLSQYTVQMCRKIQALPLPTTLKNYLNFNREF